MWFPEWETFYIVLGTSAGALAGLMFVVSALFANVPNTSEGPLDAFATPTAMHPANVLLLSMIFITPWPTVNFLRAAIGVFGLGGTVYMLFVLRRIAGQKDYAPVFEDWVRYLMLPAAGYAAPLAAAVMMSRHASIAMFMIAGGGLLLLFTALHNSWDNVIYITVGRKEKRDENV